MLLELAVPLLALAAAHEPVIRATIVSGNAQTAPAYVASAAKSYVAEFPALLVVRVTGPLPKGEKVRRVRFRCITDGCVLAPAENGEDVNRLDDAAYDVDVVDGKASVQVSIQGNRPAARYELTAKPITGKGEQPVLATFTLTTR